MNIKKKYIFPLVLSFFIFIPLVYAAVSSSSFLPEAQKYIDSNCNSKHINHEPLESAICYLFYKSQEQNIALKNQQNQITTLQNQVSTLQNQVSTIKAFLTPTVTPTVTPTPTPTVIPTPTITSSGNIDFGSNLPTNQNGPTIQVPGSYTSLTLTVTSATPYNGWSVQVSMDGGNTWLEQQRFNCGGPNCQSVTIPVIGDAYRISPGGGGSSPYFATGVFNKIPGSKALTLASAQSLPLTLNLTTTGYSSIIFTVAQTNPQNLINIQLQNFNNNTWNVEQQLNCDGGARCPLVSLPLVSGEQYRVVINGSGNSDTLVGALQNP